MKKHIRERLNLIDNVGLHLVRVEYRRKHVAFVCREGTMICGMTPSDWRERRQFRALARRLGQDRAR